MEALKVKEIQDVSRFWHAKTIKMLQNKIPNTRYETMILEKDGSVRREVKIVCYMRLVLNHVGEGMTVDQAMQRFAKMINEAVDAGLIGIGCLMPPSTMKLVRVGDYERTMLLFYPLAITNHDPEWLNRMIGMRDYFRGRGGIFSGEGEFPTLEFNVI